LGCGREMLLPSINLPSTSLPSTMCLMVKRMLFSPSSPVCGCGVLPQHGRVVAIEVVTDPTATLMLIVPREGWVDDGVDKSRLTLSVNDSGQWQR
jgi:hypothetical protein